MDFFEQQEQARHKTRRLVFYFFMAVSSMILLIYSLIQGLGIFTGFNRHPYDFASQSLLEEAWNGKLFLEVSLGTLLVIFCGSTFKILSLSAGGSALAESLDGRLVSTTTQDSDERKLLNVVEEMAIASGVPMPKVYVLDGEKGINAFACGHSTSDATVAVTHGCLVLLDRDELQGVIAHEFSHILNGDMRLNLRLAGLLFGIFCIATIGRILLNFRSSNRNDRNALPILGLALLAVGSIGLFFGRLIQASICRQREFLADASAVQFTRNPAGVSQALKKIGGYGFGSWLISNHAPDVGHFFFSNGIPRSGPGLLATHPPLEQRIRAIDPAWDGIFPRVDLTAIRQEITQEKGQPRAVFMDGKMIILGAAMESESRIKTPPVLKPHSIVSSFGKTSPMHLKYARELREAIPETTRTAAREPLGAAALLFALLLETDETLRASQLEVIKSRFSAEMAKRVEDIRPDVAEVALKARLPLVNVCLGALKQLSPADYRKFQSTLDPLSPKEGASGLFAWVLQTIVTRHLSVAFGSEPHPGIQFYSLKPLLPDCALVLSMLARAGAQEEPKIQEAFDAGIPYLQAPLQAPLELAPANQCSVTALQTSLNRLAQSAPLVKKHVLQACAHVVGADGIIQETEAELLRGVADTLDCPLPPWQTAAAGGLTQDGA